ncbi:M23 family metallopeptidase, partial [Kineococcus glutinatus]|uniref:M23 family metallopeptidase n=1 Tax=Kineococcus glutinatus TaxID=1070872 RepID=UPI0031E84D52
SSQDPSSQDPSSQDPSSQDPAGPAGPHRWPLRAPRVQRTFDRLPSPYAAGHRGVDLGAGAGTEVLASAAGTVVFAAAVAGRGVVVVAHAGGVRTTYEPVEPRAGAGTGVRAGDVIGVVAAAPAHCAGGCLHWGARRGADYLDPLTLLAPAPAPVLLPQGRPG